MSYGITEEGHGTIRKVLQYMDELRQNNKIYVNTFMFDLDASQGGQMINVCWDKDLKRHVTYETH